MKKLLVFLAVSFMASKSFAQVSDGVYSLPSIPGWYAVHISNGDLRRFYTFSVTGDWYKYEGSQSGNKSVLAITGTEINEGIELTQSPVGFVSKTTYCLPADHEACIETDLSEELTGMSALLATGSLKAVYKLQWGGELVLYESNEIAVVLLFEKEAGDDPYSHIGAYTMTISEELRLSNLDIVVESDTEDSTGLVFDLVITDLENPQISFDNITCTIADTETCDFLKKTYFTQVIRTL
ncbi:hypothetical protein N8Z76_01095 [Gammaproteobacteria bacterium]|jgi:hypothetical protein|nr:hypothetical protein [Gammaproteobacteria bacterium]